MLNGQEPTGINPQDSAENRAETETKVLAETHFQTKEEVQAYFDKQKSLEAEYVDRLKQQFDITIDRSDYRGDWQFVMVGDKKIYNWDIFINRAIEGKLVKRPSPGLQKSIAGWIDWDLSAIEARDANSNNSIMEVPRETLLALREYEQWEYRATGKFLEAAVVSGQITQEKVDEIKQSQTDDKVVVSNAGNFYFAYVHQTDKWQGDQIKWEVRDRKKE